MVTEAREKHKITAVQVRKIYELLRLRATDVSNAAEYKKYRLEVKRRLNIPFQKEKKSLQKLEKFLQPQVSINYGEIFNQVIVRKMKALHVAVSTEFVWLFRELELSKNRSFISISYDFCDFP